MNELYKISDTSRVSPAPRGTIRWLGVDPERRVYIVGGAGYTIDTGIADHARAKGFEVTTVDDPFVLFAYRDDLLRSRVATFGDTDPRN